MALFGLSPLFLSVLASSFFTDPEKGLNVTRFLKFHAMMVGCIHLIGAITLRLPVREHKPLSPMCDPEHAAEPDERSALLPAKPPSGVDIPVQSDEHNSAMDLLRDRNFWTLFFITLVVLGSVSSLLATSNFLH
jgi:hypothetical protein